MELNEKKTYIFNKDELRRIVANYLKNEIGVKLNEATTQFNWGAESVKVTVSNVTKNFVLEELKHESC